MVNTDDEIVLIVESIFKAAFPDWRGNNFHAIVDQVEFFFEKKLKRVRSKNSCKSCGGIDGCICIEMATGRIGRIWAFPYPI